jgi:hypothetical protein
VFDSVLQKTVFQKKVLGFTENSLSKEGFRVYRKQSFKVDQFMRRLF